MMEISCQARLVTLFVRNSFVRPVPSLVCLGIKARDPLEPILVLATSNVILEFEVTSNVKRIYKKEVSQGRIGIAFYRPPHHVLITTTETEQLSNFLALLCKLMDRAVMEKLEYIPVLYQFAKPSAQSRASSIKQCVDSYSTLFCQEKPKGIPLNLRERISKYLKEIDLPDCELEEIPDELGEMSVERVNLENNDLTDESLIWLEELPIRKSLQCLNLAGNKIESFPSVLIDFKSLTSLNLRDNAIETIPHTIDQMCRLEYINLSGNNIRYLPSTICGLKLIEADLTYNHLTSNVRSSFRPESRNPTRICSSLLDLALLSVKAHERRMLTHKQLPRKLLEGLRQISNCICGRQTIPHLENQFYEMLYRLNFALTCNIHPQKLDFTNASLHGIRYKGDGIRNVFLKSHFCGVCEEEYMEVGNNMQLSCYRLLPEDSDT